MELRDVMSVKFHQLGQIHRSAIKEIEITRIFNKQYFEYKITLVIGIEISGNTKDFNIWIYLNDGEILEL